MEKFVFYSGQDRKQNRTAYFVNLGKVLENIPSFLMIKMTYTVMFLLLDCHCFIFKILFR